MYEDIKRMMYQGLNSQLILMKIKKKYKEVKEKDIETVIEILHYL